MNNEISINKIIADIKATKGNRSGCQGLHSSLESDGYLTSICKWARATSPKRIDALVELIEKQEAALISWEKTMMEVCGEDGPASVANEIRALQGLRDTAMQALKAQVEQLADALRQANLTEAERQAYLGLITKRDERIEQLEKRNAYLEKRLKGTEESLIASTDMVTELESKKPDIYLCRVIRNGEELYSPCGADYPRGTGYHRSAHVEAE